MAAANLSVVHRRPLQTACKDCGQPNLQWVATAIDPSKATDNNPNGYVAYYYVPFGSSDFSEAVHPLIPCGNNSAYAKSKATQPSETPTPKRRATTTAPVADVAPPVDLRPLENRIDAVEASVAGMQPGIQKLTEVIGETATQMETKLKDMRDAIDAHKATRNVTISAPWVPAPVNLGRVHAITPNVIAAVAAIGNKGVVTLVGEAASGKSTLANAIAKGLNAKSLHRITLHEYITAPDVLGFKSPVDGKYHPSEMYEPYVNGGLGLIDELNRASPEGASVFNGITSGDETGWPDGTHIKHPECYFIAAANNYCRGADTRYNATTQLDFATLTRLVFIPMPTDWAMIGDIYGTPIKGNPPQFQDPGSPRSDTDPLVVGWGQFVKNVIDECDRQHIDAAVSARSVECGYLMLRAGIDYNLVQFSTIWSKMDADNVAQVKANLGL